MKVKRITNWYKYGHVDKSESMYIARYADEDNNQILIFCNPDNKNYTGFETNVVWAKNKYHIIDNNPVLLSDYAENRLLDKAKERLNHRHIRKEYNI